MTSYEQQTMENCFAALLILIAIVFTSSVQQEWPPMVYAAIQFGKIGPPECWMRTSDLLMIPV